MKKGKKGKKGGKVPGVSGVALGNAMNQLSADEIESINKGGVYFWLTENGNNLSVGER